jgi:hypothetical protein
VPRATALAWSAVLAASAAIAATDLSLTSGDAEFFRHAGGTLVSGDWLRTYADPAVQAGPLELLPFGLAPLAVLAVVLQVVGTWALVATVARLLRGRGLPAPWVIVGVGLAALVFDLPHSAVASGHPAQLFVPLLWLLAGLDVRDGRLRRAAVLVAISAGFETWGVLGVAVFALVPHVRPAIVAACGALAGGALLYLPFVLGGSFSMLDYAWTVNGGTLASLVLGPGAAFPWSLRVLQAALALAAGVGVAVALRRTTHALAASLAALVAVRLVLDPVSYSWYWVAFQTLVLAAVAELATSPRGRALVARSRRRARMPISQA